MTPKNMDKLETACHTPPDFTGTITVKHSVTAARGGLIQTAW